MRLTAHINSYFVGLYNSDSVQSLIRRFGGEVTLKRIYWYFTHRAFPPASVSLDGETVLVDRLAGPQLEERDVILDLLNRLRPDDVFYDIGASKGLYSIFAGNRLRDGHVVAFEPHPARRDVLRRNLDRNGISGTLRPQALSDTVGTVGFGHRIGETDFTVTSVPGDLLIAGDDLPPPTVTKFDIEGGELRAIRGLEKTLRREESRLVYVELHEYRMYEGFDSEVMALLEELGYHLDVVLRRRVNGSSQVTVRGSR